MADTNTNSGSNNGSTKTPKPEQQQQQKPQPPAVKPHLDLSRTCERVKHFPVALTTSSSEQQS